jgi:hypothetical protein
MVHNSILLSSYLGKMVQETSISRTPSTGYPYHLCRPRYAYHERTSQWRRPGRKCCRVWTGWSLQTALLFHRVQLQCIVLLRVTSYKIISYYAVFLRTLSCYYEPSCTCSLFISNWLNILRLPWICAVKINIMSHFRHIISQLRLILTR